MVRETKATFVELLVLGRCTTTYNITTVTNNTNDSYVSDMVAPLSQSEKSSDDDDDDSEEAEGASKKKFESSKLIADCYDENNYVVYYRNLKLYLLLGLKVTFIHRIVAFQQEKWLKPYIQLNT